MLIAEEMCLPVGVVLVSGSHCPKEGLGWDCCYFFAGDGSGFTQL